MPQELKPTTLALTKPLLGVTARFMRIIQQGDGLLKAAIPCLKLAAGRAVSCIFITCGTESCPPWWSRGDRLLAQSDSSFGNAVATCFCNLPDVDRLLCQCFSWTCRSTVQHRTLIRSGKRCGPRC